MELSHNLILCADSYKFSHDRQFAPNTTGMFSYLESRGGRYGSTLFFGLQYFLKRYLSQRISKADVDEAAAFLEKHGEPFNRAGWTRIVEELDGFLPVRIRAVPEGTVVPTHNVLMTVESTDPATFWIVSWLESMLVRACWYPTTVASQSLNCKRIIKEYLDETSDDPVGELPFKLHDFGARGVSSAESAGIGGMAHLVNFMGSDTVEGVRFANHYYDAKMAGFSVPAAEHSTITSWGRHGELAAYRNMLTQFATPGKIVACVSDSWNIWNAIDRLWCGELRDEVEKSGATIVIRLDSGDPPSVVLKALQAMERHVGCQTNMRGFKVLPKCWRLLQGDGIDETSIAEILSCMKAYRYSASNIAFGMGGALLQKVDRDTQRFAFKCSSATIEGHEVDIFKDPVDDPGKRSKAGRLDLVKDGGVLRTVREGEGHARSELVTVFENGRLLWSTTFDEVRARAAKGL